MPTSIIMQKLAGSSGPVSVAGGGQVVAELQAGLVAVVAVGDEDRLRRPSGPGRRCASPGRSTGQSRLRTPRWSVASSGVRSRMPASTARRTSSVGVGVEAEDRAQVVPGRLEEREPVGLRARERLLVRVDLPLAERLEPDPGEEALAGVASAPRPRRSGGRRRAAGWSSSRSTPSRSQSLRNRAARV